MRDRGRVHRQSLAINQLWILAGQNAEVVPGRQEEVDWLHALFADLCDGHIYTGLISDRQ